jgi:hypothetical protein
VAELRTFNAREADVLAAVCEVMVPGSERVSPVLYIDAAASGWPAPQLNAVRAALASWDGAVDGGEDFVRERMFTPEFPMLRALAVEAFYSDWAPPEYQGPRAWEQIGYDHPLAMRLDKDFSYLGGTV